MSVWSIALPTHVFSIVARGCSVDVHTNGLTIFSVLEQVRVQAEFPVAIPELVIATLWERLPDEEGVTFTQRTRFLGPGDEEIAHYDTSFCFDHPRHRVFGHVSMFPIRKPGRHRIEVLIRRDDEAAWGAAAASYPIEVLGPPRANGEDLLGMTGP